MRTPRAVVALSFLVASGPVAVGQTELGARIEGLISAAKLAEVQVGVHVRDLAGGRDLVNLAGTRALMPASNLKLITTGAALSVLGPNFEFRTQVLVSGETLILRGSGDPALGDPEVLERTPGKLTVDGLLQSLAASVAGAGVAKVSAIIVDDSVFDRQAVHPTWPTDQLDRSYAAGLSGVNFHANTFWVFPSPGAVGQPPTFVLQPPVPWIEVENRAQTSSSGRQTAWVRRDGDANRFVLSGEVSTAARVPITITMREPALTAGRLLASALLRAGVTVAGERVEPGSSVSRAMSERVGAAVRLVEPGVPTIGRTVATVTTHATEILSRCNKDSENLYAEALLKRLGHEVTGEAGSWTNGCSVIRMTLTEALDPEAASTTVISDGSGLSRENRVAPRTLTRWLDSMQSDTRFGSAFVGSLAMPGEGTLRERFRDKKLVASLRAKSGRIDGVRALSGYLTAPDGSRLAFSVIVNGLKKGEQELQGKQFVEDVVYALDQHLARRRK
ncbi:MAG: D-alanyl-D-alanine carboxypeptidase/D-alanyl-D-alanine-endopeptidase [Phycisphaerae bacterium]|nr:D-alanyl-D-alanine carboxypeptidase/D-alanyl-D-alanine-endopeptidase [Phycisphaerae bacterium]